jgi:hypothetical protein
MGVESSPYLPKATNEKKLIAFSKAWGDEIPAGFLFG